MHKMTTDALNKEIEKLREKAEVTESKLKDIESSFVSTRNNINIRYIKFLFLWIPFFMLKSLSSLFLFVSIVIVIYAVISTKNKKDRLIGKDSELSKNYDKFSSDLNSINKEIKELINERTKIIEELTFNTFVAGTSFRQKEIKELINVLSNNFDIYQNDNYLLSKNDLIEFGFEDEVIWEYEPTEIEVSLIDEPDNEVDDNAIAVYYISKDIDLKLGYIPKKHTNKLRDIDIEFVKAIIKGGRYKLLKLVDYDDFTDKERYSLINEEKNYSIDLKIKQSE